MKSVFKAILALSVIILWANVNLEAAPQVQQTGVAQGQQNVGMNNQQVAPPPVQNPPQWQCVTGLGYLPGQGPDRGCPSRRGRDLPPRREG